MSKKKKDQPVNVIRYFEEWYGQLVRIIIEKESVINSDDISCERVRPYYEKGLNHVDCYNELFKK